MQFVLNTYDTLVSSNLVFLFWYELNDAKSMTRLLTLFFTFHVLLLYSQQIEHVDFIRIKADLNFPAKGKVSGVMEVRFKVLKEVDSIYLDAVRMSVTEMRLSEADSANGFSSPFQTTSDKIIVYDHFKKDKEYVLHFRYDAEPKKALYFIDDQIWTQGQGKYTSNWLPSIDDMNDKIEFDLSISYSNGYEVMANGELVNKEPQANNTMTWKYDMTSPMSSYLVALVIGKYHKKTEVSDRGITLEYYYEPEDSLKVEPTYRYSKQIFDFLENEIGFPYPWEVYRQVPVRDFLYSGMENTTLTIFSDALVVDDIGFNVRNYVNVNAHELAHQWFGDLVTEVSDTHHWLQEGFATYYALLAEREIFGDDYYYWRLYEYAQQLLEQEHANEGTSLLNPKSSSVTFYQKGCWALHVLREQVGEEVFRSAVKNYLEKYQFRNVQTSDFISEVEHGSGADLSEFVKVWLEAPELPQDVMVKSLKKSEFIQEYLKVSCLDYPLTCEDYLVSDISDQAKIKILSQADYQVKQEDFNNSWEVRQAIAAKLTTIPIPLKNSYESLLKDPSYLTIETALYHLWANFPFDRAKYLSQTKHFFGFSDYNIRILWLALNLNTTEYQPDQKEEVLAELRSYTNSKFGFERRMNAFQYLKLIGGFDQVSMRNLLEASRHHNWRMVQFAKSLLRELEAQESYKSMIEQLRE